MNFSNSTRQWSETGPLFLLFFVSLAFRLPAAVRTPAPWFYDSDELVLLGSLLGLIGGETPHALQWPAATLLFAFLPLVLLHFMLTAPEAWQAISSTDPYGFADALTIYLGGVFYDPLSLLVPFRIALATVTSLTAPLVFKCLSGRLDRTERWMAAIVLATSPVLVKQTALVKGDSVGLLFWALALVLLMARGETRLTTAGALRAAATSALHLGLATASRLTLLAAWPLLPLYAWWYGPRRQILKITSRSLAAFALPLFVLLPFFWTQSFTFLKAVLGNVLLLSRQDGGGQSAASLASIMAHLTGPVAILFAVAGLVVLWLGKERRDIAALTTAAFIIFLLPLARSGHLPPHYTLPFLPVLALWTGIGAAAATRWVARYQPDAGRSLVVALATLVTLANGLDILDWLRAMQRPVAKVEIADWIQQHTRATDRLALPISLAAYVPPNGPALEAILTRYSEQPSSATQRLTGLLDAVGSQSKTASEPSFLLDAWLIDDEAIDVFRYRSMRHAARSGTTPPIAREALYFQPDRTVPSKPDRVHLDEAVESLRRGEINWLLIDKPLSDDVAAPFRAQDPGFGWRIYRKPSDVEDSTPFVEDPQREEEGIS